MKKILFLSISFITFLFAPAVLGSVWAASFQFNPSSTSTSADSSFSLDIRTDVGSEQVNSAETFVLFDSNLIEAQSVSAGSFFPSVSNNIEAGRVYVAGMVEDAASSKTGSGTVATIMFKALTNGTATLTFDCNNSKIVKADINATNIITCDENGTGTVVIGAGGGDGIVPTSAIPVPTSLPQTGILDNLSKAAIPGLILLFVGGIIKLLI